ncbi:MAG TPA: DUF4838 domain-containing protein, partial [Tepidisphaeraceae bacterium]|nr:DUF4838 domain-containing protein [Tepidisphaeraceae bacterium]
MKPVLPLIAALVVCVSPLLARAGEAWIVEHGVAHAQIIIAAENRPRMATLAALELQRHIQKLSGARLPIVTSPDANLPVKIYVGSSPAAAKLGVTGADLKYGAFRIVSGTDWLVLLGNDFDFTPPAEPPRKPGDAKPGEPNPRAPVDDPAAGKTKREASYRFKSDAVLDAYYGGGAAALWLTGGNTTRGFEYEDENGSLNAVCAFVRGLGVRWFMPGELGEVRPDRKSIGLAAVNTTELPDTHFRSWMWNNYARFSFEDVLWARRIGINSPYQKVGPAGGAHGLTHVHRGEAMKKAHPEYYALLNGKRDTEHRGHGTPCFTSEGLIRATIDYCRSTFDNTGVPAVDLWPGDGLSVCGCDGCKGKSAADLVWGFTDRVARELYKTHPDKLIIGGAYTTYKDVSDKVGKFTPNVAVKVSNSGRPMMNDPEHWADYVARMERWKSKVAPGNLFRYENNLYHLWGREDGVRGAAISYPVIHPRAMAKDLKYLKGVALGGNGEVSQYRAKWQAMGLEHITLYVQSRFYWDADLDVDQVLDEYCTLFYGPAARAMKEAIDFAEANLAYKDVSRGRGRGNPMNVSLKTALELRRLLDKAKAAAGDTVYGRRVQALISELQPTAELVAKYKARDTELAERRANAPLAVGVDGPDLSAAIAHKLKANRGGKEAVPGTTFKLAWDKDALLIEIHCQEPDMTRLVVAPDVVSGDHLAVSLETPNHAYYHLEVNPDGRLVEGNPSG